VGDSVCQCEGRAKVRRHSSSQFADRSTGQHNPKSGGDRRAGGDRRCHAAGAAAKRVQPRITSADEHDADEHDSDEHDRDEHGVADDNHESITMKPLLARVLAFFTSASILVLEILAGRLLAPFVGVTLETYTSIIGVVLAGIALGSWAGGRLADSYDPRRLVGPTMMIGGALGLLCAPIVRSAARSLDGTSVSVVLLATIAGFFPPSLVLSAVSPMLTKTQLQSLSSSGRTVGSMSAIATAGSIVGTFVTGFLLVAKVPVSTITLAVGLSLLAVGFALTLSASGWTTQRPLAMVLLVVGGGSGVASVSVKGPCQVESAYYCASVFGFDEEPSIRTLRLDNLDHSEVDINNALSLRFSYTQLFGVVADALPPGPVHAVHLGGGALTMPRYIRAARPGSTGVVLEVDGALPELAEEQLGWVPGPDVKVEIGDGRTTMGRQPKGKADIVFGDAFGAEAVPWHLTTVEFTQRIRDVLKPTGVYVLNAIDADRNAFVKAEIATILQVFEHVAVLAPQTGIDGEGSNFVVVASNTALPTDSYQRAITVNNYDAVVLKGSALRSWIGDAIVLRDDFAPVDQLFSTGQ
jgi:spermidine synthase